MSCSKPLPPFTYELLCFLNRDQLERFSIICRPLKNLIERYFQSKPYRVFDGLGIRGGSYALVDDDVPWHPNREDYSAQQFLAGQKCSIDESKVPCKATYYSFAEMRPYFCPTVRINWTSIIVAGEFTHNPDHIAEMESIAYLWRDGDLRIGKDDNIVITAEDFQLILNSPTILQCRRLKLVNARFPFKNYKILYTVKVIELFCYLLDDVDPNYWLEFLEQPGVKPIVALHSLCRENIDNALDHLKQAFSSAVSPNAFKVVFVQLLLDEPLTKFRVTNKTSGENLELKKGLPVEYPEEWLADFDNYTFERSSV